jgi:hypothetical protein
MKHGPRNAGSPPDELLLEAPGRFAGRLAAGWLLLALGALIGGGVLTIVIVMSRTPYLQDVFPWVDIFHTALVVHVDLTVLVWFLAMAGVFWSMNRMDRWRPVAWGGFWLTAGGSAIIALSPFLGAGGPMMTNYIPVLDDRIFFTGLVVFAAGFIVLVVDSLASFKPVGGRITGQGALRFGLFTSLLAAVVAVGAFIASYLGVPRLAELEKYYEVLFWGGGHALQFVHVQLMLVSWLWLAAVAGIASRLTPRIILVLFAIGLIPVLLTPAAYMAFDADSPDHLQTMTWLMRFGGGLAAVPIALVVLYNLASNPARVRHLGPEGSALFASMILFGAGGLIGYLIKGSDVTVPAHYHGSIVAVTLAYMGVTYYILPLLGFLKPRGRLVVVQPWLYGGGQLLHVAGLAWSGGYGVPRKSAGEEQLLDGIEKIAGMSLMGIGGLISVAGGIAFLVIAIRCIQPARRLARWYVSAKHAHGNRRIVGKLPGEKVR